MVDVKPPYRALRLALLDYIRLGEEVEDELDETRAMATAKLFLVRFFFGKMLRTGKAVASLTKEGFGQDAIILMRTIYDTWLDLAYLEDQQDVDLYMKKYAEADLIDQLNEAEIWIAACGGRHKALKEKRELVYHRDDLVRRIKRLNSKGERDPWRRIVRGTKRAALDRVFGGAEASRFRDTAIIKAIEHEGDSQVHSRPAALRTMSRKEAEAWKIRKVEATRSKQEGSFAEMTTAFILDQLLHWVIDEFQLTERLKDRADALSKRVERANKNVAAAKLAARQSKDSAKTRTE